MVGFTADLEMTISQTCTITFMSCMSFLGWIIVTIQPLCFHQNPAQLQVVWITRTLTKYTAITYEEADSSVASSKSDLGQWGLVHGSLSILSIGSLHRQNNLLKWGWCQVAEVGIWCNLLLHLGKWCLGTQTTCINAGEGTILIPHRLVQFSKLG